ncbi:NUDIX domain-containing protein [Nonomuraea sp. K274]|uniref:NUDIX domain-containing protein n=2 Tax=Nonomuraea cypriaca TaxID=1187855 RepID=A0A931F0A1_9ACTN|nr:NUDIX domain-containing protein [Nonomuraea cypriaca]
MQVLPDGTGGEGTVTGADLARLETETAAANGVLTWRHILAEEVFEAFAESDPGSLRAELIQVAAVAVKWVQALDHRPPSLLDRRPPPALDGRPLPGLDRRPPSGLDPDSARSLGFGPQDRFRAVIDVHILLPRAGKVLLGRRTGTGYGDGLWHLPSGHLEAGESAADAAVREAGEELGVTMSPDDLTFSHVMHRAPERVGLFFTAAEWHGEPYNAEPHKCSEVAWWPMDELPADMVGYAAAAIANILARIPFALHQWPADR